MSIFRSALTVAAKDLRVFARDRIGLLLGFALPTALVLVFGFLMSLLYGEDGAMGKVEIWVADADGSEESRALLAALRRSQMLVVRPRVGADGAPEEQARDADALRERIEDGDAHHALVLDAGFGAALREGRDPPLRLLRDPGREMEDQLVRIGLATAWMETSRGRGVIAMMDRMTGRLDMPEPTRALVREATERQGDLISRWVEERDEGVAAGDFDFSAAMTGMVPLIEVDVAPPDRNQEVDYIQAQSVGGIAVMMLMFGLVACGSTLLQERDGGTLRRLLALPVQPDALLLGKFIFTFVVGLVQLVFLFALGEAVFGIGIGNDPVTLLLHSVVVTAAVTAFGILVAAWARTQKQAEGVSTLLILVMSCLGGAWFPLQMFALPAGVEVAMKSTLTHWAVSGYQGLFWNGLAWHDPAMLRKTAVLLGFTLVAGLAARALFRARYVGRR